MNYAPPPHGSFPPQAMPPRRPEKSKSSAPAWIALGGFAFLCASAAGLFGYLMLRAQTPEGKAEIAAARAKELAVVEDAVQMLANMSTKLPAHDDGEMKCAQKVPLLFATRVDSAYLRLVAGDAAARALSDDLSFFRSLEVGRDLLTAADALRAGKAREPGFASANAKRIVQDGPLEILAVDTWRAPVVEGGEFQGGEMFGQVVLFDRATRQVLCHAPVHAVSSESVDYGGGVRFRVKGIPTPKVGGSGSLAEAVKKDFQKNVEADMTRALRAIGAKD